MIPRTILGRTDIKIPRLFVGTGSWDFKSGCKQEKIAPQDYAPILKKAYEAGINFWDTSDDYHTHEHIRLGMEGIPRENLIIATKTYASSAGEVRKSLQRSMRELGTSYVDLFYLHSVDSLDGFHARMIDALPTLLKAKQDGLIRAIGLSAHTIHVLEQAAENPELDVIFTNFNKFEVHMDASLQWYTRCLEQAHANGKGVLVMKTLGEGRLADRLGECLRFNLSCLFIHGVCVGITSLQELDAVLLALQETDRGSLHVSEK